MSPDLTPIRVDARADAGAPRRVAALLARAFQDDPQMVAAFPDAERRARSLPWLIGLNVRYGCLYGEVYATPQMEGAVVWLPPTATMFTFSRIARAGMLAAPFKVSWRALGRLAVMERYAARLRLRHAPMPHWYLSQIGVVPSHQGRGLGSALLRSTLARIDAEQGCCYLETTKQANVRFYQQHGFRVVGDGETYAGGPHVWGSLRAPGADGAAHRR